MLKLAVTGCTGRMGQMVLKEANQDPNVEIVGAITRLGNPFVGQDIGNLIGESPFNLQVTDIPEKAFVEADVVIDFSSPQALETNLNEAVNQQKPYIACITGINDTQKANLEKASHKVPLIYAPNTSLGIALLRKLAHLAGKILGPSYDISLLEMHHGHKADAPSGTSLSLIQTLENLDHLKKSSKSYSSVSPRPPGTIECAPLRGGGVIGDHSVIFAGEKEMLTLEHRTLDRALFAQGALKAAQWLADKPKGFYTMDDVVGISL